MSLPVTVETLPLPPTPDGVGRLSAFTGLTYPRFQPLLTGADPAAETGCAVCAWQGGQPAGLALVVWDVHDRQGGRARLLSVMVPARLRRQGIGRALLTVATEQARAAGATALRAQHNSRLKMLDAYTACLDACGWPPPVLALVREQAPARWALDAAQTYARPYARLVRRGYAMKRWDEAGAADFDQVRALLPQAQTPDGLPFDPFQEGDSDDPALSVLLLRGQEVCGWIKARWEPPPPDQPPSVVYYHTGWVRPDLARQGWLVMAMIDVSRRQAALAGPDTITAYGTHGANLAMQGILSDRFGAFAERIDRLYDRVLPLTAG